MPMLSANCFAQDIEYEQKNLLNNPCQKFEIKRAPKFQFQNLEGLNINIVPNKPIYGEYGQIISLRHCTCFIMPTVNYIKSMGFDDTGKNEHTLNIYFKHIHPSRSKASPSASWLADVSVKFVIEMTNKDSEVIFEQEVSSFCTDKEDFYDCLNEAYTQALEQINWYKIYSFLKESSAPKQQVKQESKEVKGYGNTDLENTIVRWEVQSRPAGADVFWRVVSKTPSVKSTNNKYLQTTPYEATKSLDIRGLSYENSGDVRVILRCEKDGYYPQEKEFNVRMIIDQEEISAFFKLVKVE